MKNLSIFIAATLLLLGFVNDSDAGELYRWQNFTTVFTNTVSQDLSLTTSFTNVQNTGQSVYHTFQIFYSVSGTNGGATFAIDRTIDGSNWINVTNWSFSTAATNEEVLYEGKWAQYRFRETDLATNGLFKINYIAQ